MKISQDGAPVARDDRSKLITAIKNTPYNGHLSRVPNFGVWHPNIREAAELVVVDMWFSGEIDGVNEPDDFNGNGRSPWLITALADNIAKFETRLLSAVN